MLAWSIDSDTCWWRHVNGKAARRDPDHTNSCRIAVDGCALACLQDATLVQLSPYGWDLPDGSVCRETLYSGIAVALNATYFRWVSHDVQNAFLRECGRRQ